MLKLVRVRQMEKRSDRQAIDSATDVDQEYMYMFIYMIGLLLLHMYICMCKVIVV